MRYEVRLFLLSCCIIFWMFASSSVGSFAQAPAAQETAAEYMTRTAGQRPQGIPIGFESEWQTDSAVGLSKTGAEIRIPLLFLRRADGPPPMVNIGFNQTDLFAAGDLGLPNKLYETTIGISTVRRFNESWAVRAILGADFGTDGQNLSSDAWQFRGGAFAIYEQSPKWTWSFGAIALGRSDLPVVPAIGAVWQPGDRCRCDFILPNPKLNFMLSDDGQRQNWAYLGVGLNGNTWGYQRRNGSDDQLSYGDWRAVVGWESRPSAPPGVPFVIGRKYSVELGYVFSRDLELDDRAREISLDDSFMIRASTRF